MDITCEELTEEIAERLRENCRSPIYPAASVRVQPSGCVHTALYSQHANRFRDFSIREDDVWVASYPKCGTTWTQEMVWLIANDLDFDKAKNVPLNERVPFFESPAIASMPITSSNDLITSLENLKTRRFFKTHLTKDLLPQQVWSKKPKIVYVSRDPKDAVVSYYHHHRLWNGYSGTFQDFYDAFLADVLVYSPFWDHVLDYWRLRDEPNVLYNTYEEMKRHLSFQNMRSNPATNLETYAKDERKRYGLTEDPNLKFIRQGESGGWRKEMSDAMAAKIDSWTRDKLRGSGYPLPQVQVDGKGHDSTADTILQPNSRITHI
ncbi:Sulfotransferase family cytosolic 1B member 1 [Blattella germanica]|nr:Sulfotransferase family cytosolic 1B member 1 [Blattella germanica]